MKKIFSACLAFAMLISLCVATTVAAAERAWVIDTVNNIYTNHFDGATHTERYDESGGYCRNTSTTYAIPAGDSDTALKMESKSSASLASQWSTRADIKTPLVTGTNIQMSFDFRIDGSSMTTAEPKVMRIQTGTPNASYTGILEWSEFLMKIKHNGTNWNITFVNTDKNTYNVLCSVAADTWQKITLIFDLENGTYDAYAGGKALHDMKLLESSQDTANTTDADNVITRADISDVQFHNTGVYSYPNSAVATHDSIYYVDNLRLETAQDAVIDFEDGNFAGNGDLTDSAAIESTTAKDGGLTKALSITYEDSGAKISSWSRWNADNSKAIVNDDEATVGFDFKIDDKGTVRGLVNGAGNSAHYNPGNPTLLHYRTNAGEECKLVSCYYIGQRGYENINGPDKWEIRFFDKTDGWVSSGHTIGADEWASIDVALHLAEGTYDAYVDGICVLKGLKLSESGKTYLRNINFTALKISAYNVNVLSTWKVYVDNITYDSWSWSKITASDAALLDVSSSVAAAGTARTYRVTINNPNTLGESAYFAMRAIDSNRKMQDIVFEKVNLTPGTMTFEKTFKNLNANEAYDVKAFFINLKDLTPYSEEFATLSSPIE